MMHPHFFKSVSALLFVCCSYSVVLAQGTQTAQAAPIRQQEGLARDATRTAGKLERNIAVIERRIEELNNRKGGLQWVLDIVRHVASNPAEYDAGKPLYRMGQIFESSAEDMGLEADPFEAVHWYKKAAMQHNHIEAQYRLGRIYLEGRNVDGKNGISRVTQSANEAAKWFEQAAKQDHPQAQYLLAALLVKGWGVRKNEREAEKWLAKAAENGMKIDRAAFDKLKDTPFAEWTADLE